MLHVMFNGALFLAVSLWHPQVWAKCLHGAVYGLSQALQMGFIEGYNFGWAIYDIHFEMWSTGWALWWDYMAFIWDGDSNSKGDQGFLSWVGPQLESALIGFWGWPILPALFSLTLNKDSICVLAAISMSRSLSWQVLGGFFFFSVLGIESFNLEIKYKKIDWQKRSLKFIDISKKKEHHSYYIII